MYQLPAPLDSTRETFYNDDIWEMFHRWQRWQWVVEATVSWSEVEMERWENLFQPQPQDALEVVLLSQSVSLSVRPRTN